MPGRLSVPARRLRDDDDDDDSEDLYGDSRAGTPQSYTSNGSKRARITVQDSADSSQQRNARDNSSSMRGDEEEEDSSDTLESGDQERPFKPGSIVRVKLVDFVTYSQAEFHLGPSLNMIIGPNGTGKSTLVCAICLGLGWGPQHLGRAKDIGEFVRHGCREADIEIELAAGPKQRDGRNPIIRRNIKKEGNKSQFSLNGRQCSKETVLKLAKEFSIQIDNLCQFLPQDRVVEFAALSPVALLESTQRAAAQPQMIEWHTELKTLYSAFKEKQGSQEHDKETLRTLEARQNAAQADVDRLRERQELQNRMRILEESRPIVQYRQAMAEANEAKQKRSAARHDLKVLEERAGPTLQELTAKQTYLDQIKRVKEQRAAIRTRAEGYADQQFEKYRRQEENIQQLKDSNKNLKDSDGKIRTEIRKVEDQIQKLNNQLASAPPDIDLAEYNEKIRMKKRELREIKEQAERVKKAYEDIRRRAVAKKTEEDEANHELASLRSQAGQQLNKLKQVAPDTWKAWDWIQKNKSMFKEKVYGPAMVECSVKNKQFARLIEACLQAHDFVTITCTNGDDFQLLSEKLMGRNSLNLSQITLHQVTRPLSSFGTPVAADSLQDYGLDGWILDQLEGPEPVLVDLCDNAKLHQTGYSLHKITEDQFRRLESSPIATWLDTENRYRVTRRREYNISSTTVTALRPPKVWTEAGVDTGIEHQLKRSIAELRSDLEEMKKENDELSQQRQNLYEQNTELENEIVSGYLPCPPWRLLKLL
jgi:structural maintenance of chromosomes protein 5